LNPRTPTGWDPKSIGLSESFKSRIESRKIRFDEQIIKNILNQKKIANRSDHHLIQIEWMLKDFAKAVNWEFDFDGLTEFLDEKRKTKSPRTYRKYVLFIRWLLKELGVEYWNKLQLPKVPKPRKIIIQKDMVKQLIINLWNLRVNQVSKFRAITAFMLGATSGLRTEEITRLDPEDIDLENRVVYVRFGKSKDVEERITFFNHETQAIMRYYFEIYDGRKELFNHRTLKYLYEEFPEAFKVNGLDLRLKHMRKFFVQEWERRGGTLAIKRMLAGGSEEDNAQDPKRLLTGHNSVEIELESYNFQEVEDLKRIYDAVGIRIFD